VIIEIKGSDLIAASRNGIATAEIFVYAFDDDGLVRDSLFQRVALDLEKVPENLRSAGIKYYGTLSLPAGRYAVKSLVRVAESQARGYARRDIRVPQGGDVAISQPLFIEEPGKWLMIKGSSNDKTHAAYPFEVDGQPFIPSAAVSAKSDQPRKFVVFVQNATPDEMTFDTTPKTSVVTQLRSENGSKVVFELGATSASALNVVARKKGSTDERTSSVPLVP